MPHSDPEARRAYSAAYRERNREKARVATMAWRLANPDRARKADRCKRENNPGLYRAIAKRAADTHYAAHREEVIVRGKAWRKANPDKVRAYSAAHREADPERQREYVRAWRKRNPEAVRAHAEKRRSRERGATVTELINRVSIYERDGGRCHLCGRFVSRKKFTLDHLVPLVLGGDHTAANVKVAHGVCNSRKGARFISPA